MNQPKPPITEGGRGRILAYLLRVNGDVPFHYVCNATRVIAPLCHIQLGNLAQEGLVEILDSGHYKATEKARQANEARLKELGIS